ncbi:MAG: Hpt domain-containing protein, partial [Litoreibacter sp.]|nr:Hpt domain-containing protein [Litoreibacter sp.]
MSDSLRDTFFAECEDLLDSLTEGLAVIEDGDEDLETINAIFRAVHSIKGAAGAFALENLVGFAHKYETVLDLIRAETLAIDEQVLHLITRSADCLADLVDLAREGSDEVPEAHDKITENLIALAGEQPEQEKAEETTEFVFEALPFAPIEIETSQRYAKYVISFTPVAAMYRNGHDPIHIFLELAGLGEFSVKSDLSRIPTLASLDPDESYISWIFLPPLSLSRSPRVWVFWRSQRDIF